MATLKPSGVNHLALSTTNMKRQLQFWCDALGLPLKALYWMHGVEGAYHGFVELARRATWRSFSIRTTPPMSSLV